MLFDGKVKYKHHAESIENMIQHYRENNEIKALFLIGSIATGMERIDSDIDAVAVVSQDYYDKRKNSDGLEEVYFGKCTYDGGYFNIHYMTSNDLIRLAECGSEPMRNMFYCVKTLFTDDEDLSKFALKIPVFQKDEVLLKQFKFYCTLKMSYTYFWKVCKPQGFSRFHTANRMIYCLYRLILIENEILFPSMRKLEEYVIHAPNKPPHIVETCQRFMKILSDEDCLELIESYETWTSYNYPKEHVIIMNNFSDPYEFQ